MGKHDILIVLTIFGGLLGFVRSLFMTSDIIFAVGSATGGALAGAFVGWLIERGKSKKE